MIHEVAVVDGPLLISFRKDDYTSKNRTVVLFYFFIVLSTAGFTVTSQLTQSNAAFSVMSHVFREALHGHLNGDYQGKPNHSEFSILQPGDVVLCHNRNGGYGYWTHAVVYVGNDMAVDAYNFVKGTAAYPVRHYLHYDELCVLRADADTGTRRRIADFARASVGKPYDPFGNVHDIHSEYCSKLVWQAHLAAGITLCPATAWILPDDLRRSTALQLVAHWTS